MGSGIPSTTERLVYLILRAQQINQEVLKGLFLFQEIDFTGERGVAHEWDAFNLYHRHSELGSCLEVMKAKPSIFLMIKLSAREDGGELLKITHGIGLRTRAASALPNSQSDNTLLCSKLCIMLFQLVTQLK